MLNSWMKFVIINKAWIYELIIFTTVFKHQMSALSSHCIQILFIDYAHYYMSFLLFLRLKHHTINVPVLLV